MKIPAKKLFFSYFEIEEHNKNKILLVNIFSSNMSRRIDNYNT